MSNFEILQMVIGSGGILGITIGLVILVFRTGRIVQKIETIECELKEFKKESKQEFQNIRQEVKEEFKNFRHEIKEEFLKVRSEIKSEVAQVGGEVLSLAEGSKRMQSDISDIKERVAFMEAFIFFSEFKAENNTSRSETMKEIWKKRRMKQVQSREE